MEHKTGKSIIVLIDYFTRKISAKSIGSKSAKNIVKLIDTIYNKFTFEKIITDNGLESDNDLV